jgi:integrase
MAVDRKQFTQKIDTGIKSNSDYTKFYLNFKFHGKSKQIVLDYSKRQWDKRTRISNAKAQLILEKNKEINEGINFNENSTLNTVAEIYFDLACEKSAWTKNRQDTYNLYCKNSIGNKKIKLIRQVDIDSLRKSMEKQGHSKQTLNGCSPRSIKKVLIQILKPILTYAHENKVISEVPIIKSPKQHRNKKIVQNATQKFTTLYKEISNIFDDDPFYRALFLFALYGRRWNEIRTLHWNEIDFSQNSYTILAQYNKLGIDQHYDLPIVIKSALLLISDNHKGLIFKSPKTNKELYPPKRQLEKIKQATGIEKLTMHYFRHILVSAMGEHGIANTILSASLGHTNLDTVNQFYLTVNHKEASKTANLEIEKLF